MRSRPRRWGGGVFDLAMTQHALANETPVTCANLRERISLAPCGCKPVGVTVQGSFLVARLGGKKPNDLLAVLILIYLDQREYMYVIHTCNLGQ